MISPILYNIMLKYFGRRIRGGERNKIYKEEWMNSNCYCLQMI
jgi:hypothetical protein